MVKLAIERNFHNYSIGIEPPNKPDPQYPIMTYKHQENRCDTILSRGCVSRSLLDTQNLPSFLTAA